MWHESNYKLKVQIKYKFSQWWFLCFFVDMIMLMCVQVVIFLVRLFLISYLLILKKRGVFQTIWVVRCYHSTSGCDCVESSCKKIKMAATVFMVFWLHFCIVDGSGDDSICNGHGNGFSTAELEKFQLIFDLIKPNSCKRMLVHDCHSDSTERNNVLSQ